ncbi:MAG: hypothetical protein ABEI86_06605, partial [Halobacteriaceae archaeon]
MTKKTVLLLLLVVLAAVAVPTATAQSQNSSDTPPPPITKDEHGFSKSESARLWSWDNDSMVNASDWKQMFGENRSAWVALANATDIPFDHPPKAVETWNTRDLEDFPSTNKDKSIHPPTASLKSGAIFSDPCQS